MRRRLVLVLMTLGLLSGCAGMGHGRDIDDPTNSLVFGYIDMDEARTGIGGAWILQVTPPSDSPDWYAEVKRGIFRTGYLPPGTYQVSSFYGSSLIFGSYEYGFPRQGRNPTTVRITKPGIYFMGSYKYKKAYPGLLQHGSFKIEMLNKPGERELLRRLLEDSAIRNSRWGGKVRARIKELGG
jgi:hypothetical protein